MGSGSVEKSYRSYINVRKASLTIPHVVYLGLGIESLLGFEDGGESQRAETLFRDKLYLLEQPNTKVVMSTYSARSKHHRLQQKHRNRRPSRRRIRRGIVRIPEIGFVDKRQ